MRLEPVHTDSLLMASDLDDERLVARPDIYVVPSKLVLEAVHICLSSHTVQQPSQLQTRIWRRVIMKLTGTTLGRLVFSNKAAGGGSMGFQEATSEPPGKAKKMTA